MLGIFLSDYNIKLIASIVCSIIVTGVFIRMSFSYTYKRAGKKYARGKKRAPSIASFAKLSKILFVSSMLLTLTGYWLESVLFLKINSTPFIMLLGACLVLYGYLKLERAFSNLGDNYSPLFEAYFPAELVTSGAYNYIRHPIYLYNLFVSFGLAISSASGLVLISAITGLIFVIKAIRLEEKYLLKAFPQYKEYAERSWKLIPRIY